MRDAGHIDALIALVGEGNVLSDHGDCERYEIDARDGSRGRAACVVLPQSTEQASAVVSHCVRNSIQIIAQSGNTSLVGGSTPDASGSQVVVSFERLRSPLDVDVQNRVVRVGAGVRLSALNERLEQSGLTFPIDLGADPCVGGMVASNTGGARYLRYGDVRANVLGLEVVLLDGNGTVLNLLGGLRKNNVGLDAKQIFIGTGGRFGLVTAAELEVHRRPRDIATALLVPRDGAAVMELLGMFEAEAEGELTAFEGMSGNAVAAALDHVPSLRNPFGRGDVPDFCILVELSRTHAPGDGELAIGQRLQAILEHVWTHAPGLLADAYVGSPKDIWALRHALPEGLRAGGRVIAFDVSFARNRVMAFRDMMTTELADAYPELRVCDFGHVADGGLHFNLVEPAGAQSPMGRDQIADLRAFVNEKVVRTFGGSFSAEHGIGRSNAMFYRRYVPSGVQRLENSLDRVFGSWADDTFMSVETVQAAQ